MIRKKKTPPPLTPNQIVALGIEREREGKGWTQQQTVVELRQFGLHWSRVSYAMSVAASTKKVRRPREFNADQITAFACTFGVPVSKFFTPPADRPVKLPGRGAPLTSEEIEFVTTGRKR
jgi:hypothetical protein